MLLSGNVLSILELWHGASSCIKIFPFCENTMHSHESVFHSHNYRLHSRVWCKQNDKYHDKYIQTTVNPPVSVCKSGETLAAEACLF